MGVRGWREGDGVLKRREGPIFYALTNFFQHSLPLGTKIFRKTTGLPLLPLHFSNSSAAATQLIGFISVGAKPDMVSG